MKITGAKWAAGTLTLATTDPEAIRFALAFNEGDYTISPSKKRRSLDANAYASVLMDKLATAMRISKTEVYRNAVRDIGGNSDVLCITEEAYPEFKRHWEANGTGWQTEAVPSKIPKCMTVTAWYGSSVYDTRQMSLLIDHLVQDCKALGIETLSPDKLAGMMEAWDGRS